MEKLSVLLKNCYGINFFEKEFDFSKCNANLIYAPNGVMKTSLAKTFLRLSNGLEPEEKIYNRKPSYKLSFDGKAIENDEIFVIEPFNPDFESKNLSTLLVNSKEKIRYDKIYKKIIEAKKKLITELNKLSKIKKDDIENQIVLDLGCENIFEAIDILSSEENGVNDYSGIQYKVVFDPKVLDLLKDEKISDGIGKYIEKYNALIDESSLFKRDVFNPVKADVVSNSLKKESFFEADHKVVLNGIEKSIEDSKTLEQIISSEKQSILKDENLNLISQRIIDGVAAVKSFQDLLEQHPEIAIDLGDLQSLRIAMWRSYYYFKEDLFLELVSQFEKGKEELQEIEEKALLEKTQWFDAQKVFTERFDIPFSIEIENQKNAILGTTAPNIVFVFKDKDAGEKRYNRGQLKSLDVLSVGERRALYLLYVIFEFKARMLSGKRTLIVIDDIADSFDYKNKYAIVEYLKEMAEEDLLRMLVMTHNFDFYRTFQSRVLGSTQWDNSFIAHRSDQKINLLKGGSKNVTNPFELWKSQFGKNDAMLVSMIPFVRNLVEYRSGSKSEEYIKLTSMLHIKNDTDALLVEDLEKIVAEVLKDVSLDPAFDKSKKVIEQIYETAENLCNVGIGDEVSLEGKIALSIAIRLKAEEFMWSKVVDGSDISGMQTGKLFDRLVKENIPATEEFIETKKVLSRVVLMTPENIHLNSFMYEPLIDISNHHLVSLFASVKKLQEQ